MRLIKRCLHTVLALCVLLVNVGAVQIQHSDPGDKLSLKRFSIDDPSWLEKSLERMAITREEEAPYSQSEGDSSVGHMMSIPATLYSSIPRRGNDNSGEKETHRKGWYLGGAQLSRDYEADGNRDADLNSDVEKRPWGSMFSSPSSQRLSSSILARGFKLGKRPWGSVFSKFGKRPWGSVFSQHGKRPWGSVFSQPGKRPWGSVFSHIGKRPWGSVFNKWNKRDFNDIEELRKRPWGPSFGGMQRGGSENSLFSSGFKFGKRPWGSVFNWKGGYQGSPKLTKRPWGSVFSGSRNSGSINLHSAGGNGFKFGKRDDEVMDGDQALNKRPWGPIFGEKSHKRPWGSVFGSNYRIGKRVDV